MLLKRLFQSRKPTQLFVSYVLQYPVEPNFTYVNDVLDVPTPKGRVDVANIEALLRAKLVDKMRNDDRTVRITLLNWKEL